MVISDDTTRKIYRIIYNKYRHEWVMYDITLIARLSMRHEKQVKESINCLVKDGYLQWDKRTEKFRVPFK